MFEGALAGSGEKFRERERAGFVEESLPFQAHPSGRVDEAVLKGRCVVTPPRPGDTRSGLGSRLPTARGLRRRRAPAPALAARDSVRGPFGCVRGNVSKGRGRQRAAESPSEKRRLRASAF